MYQDVQTCLQFLNYFQSKQIKEIYVDFEFDEADQRSTDIKIVLIDGTIKIIEVKSGENFKQDRRRNETSEAELAMTVEKFWRRFPKEQRHCRIGG